MAEASHSSPGKPYRQITSCRALPELRHQALMQIVKEARSLVSGACDDCELCPELIKAIDDYDKTFRPGYGEEDVQI